MAAGRIVLSEYMPARDRSDRLVPGALLFVYLNGTTSPATIYTDADLSVPLSNPVVANSSGQFVSIWAEGGTAAAPVLYTLSITGPHGESIGNPSVFDDYQPSAAETAADSAATAVAAKTAALAAQAAAETAETNAEAAETGAETQLALVTAAATAALSDIDDAAAALFYDDTTAGLAGTVDGEFFKTFAEDRIVTYKNVTGSAVLKSTAPKKADVDAMAVRVTPFANDGFIGTSAETVQSLDLTATDYATLYTEELHVKYATRNTSTTFYFIIARVSDGVEVASVGAGGTSIDPTGYTGIVKLPLLAVNSSGITGSVRIDFGDGSTFGTLVPFATTDTPLDMDKSMFANPERADVIETIAETKAAALTDVFVAGATDAYAKSVFRRVKVEGGDAGHDYYLNYETTFFAGIPLYRMQVQLWDDTLGLKAAEWSMSDAADITADIPDTIFLTLVALGATQAGYLGITATIEVDRDAITWDQAQTTYTDMAATGLRTEHTVPNEVMDGFYALANPRRRITVGTGTETATHFNTVAGAVQSLYLPGVTVTRSTYPISDICTFSEQVLIEVIDDAHDEEIAATTITAIDQSTVVLPHYVTLKLRPDTVLWMDAAGNTAPVLEVPFSCRIEGGTIWQKGEGYVLHIDSQNNLTKRAIAGPAVLRHKHRIILKDVTLKSASTDGSGSLIGQGQSDGSGLVLDGVRMIRTGVGAAPLHLCHTSPDSLDPGFIHYKNVIGEGQPSGVPDLQLLKSHTQTDRHRVVVENSDLTEVEAGYTGSETAPHAFVRVGRFDGFSYTADLDPTAP